MYPPNNIQNVPTNVPKILLLYAKKWYSNVPSILFTRLPCTLDIPKMRCMFPQYTHWTHARNIFRNIYGHILNVIDDHMLDTCWDYILDVPQMWLVDTLGGKWSRACNLPKMFPLVSRAPHPQCDYLVGNIGVRVGDNLFQVKHRECRLEFDVPLSSSLFKAIKCLD